jgi:hypothetical protein
MRKPLRPARFWASRSGLPTIGQKPLETLKTGAHWPATGAHPARVRGSPPVALQTRHRVQAPLVRHALERVRAAIVEGDSGATDEILNGARDEDFAAVGCGCDACAGVDGDSGWLNADELALARMDAHPDVELEIAQAAANRVGAADGARRAVEGREEAVASGVDFTPAVASDLSTDNAVVLRQEIAPGAVAEFRRPRRRADEIGEEHGY